MKVLGKVIILSIITIILVSCSASFIPKDFNVPIRLETDTFILRPIKVSDAQMDYVAVMESIEIIHNSLLSEEWPPSDFTLIENREQIKVKEKRFKKKQSFTFTVLDKSENNIIGCVYIYKGRYGPDAAVFMWVRHSEFQNGLDPILEDSIRNWIEKEWPFEWVVFPGRDR